jgi:hypothetical protein
MFTFFISLTVLGLIVMVVSSIAITSWLMKQGVKINWFFIRVLIIKYVDQYRRMTKEQTGKPGPWFYSYVSSMILMAVFAIVAVIIKLT